MKITLMTLRQSFREFYGDLPIEDLVTNKKLSVSIERIETLFRKILE